MKSRTTNFSRVSNFLRHGSTISAGEVGKSLIIDVRDTYRGKSKKVAYIVSEQNLQKSISTLYPRVF